MRTIIIVLLCGQPFACIGSGVPPPSPGSEPVAVVPVPQPTPSTSPLDYHALAVISLGDAAAPMPRALGVRLSMAQRQAFGPYLIAVHNRIHPLFAEDFIDSLATVPSSDPINNPSIFVTLEIVLDGGDGHIVKMGVVRQSGVAAFDARALDSVRRAAPFGKAPRAILSSDGYVYFDWQFHRNPVFACSAINARAFLLDMAAVKAGTPELRSADGG